MRQILWFENINLDDVAKVGGKNASLGEMVSGLRKEGILVPNGFALTADIYFDFLEKGKIKDKIKYILKGLNVQDVKDLHGRCRRIQNLILKTSFSKDIEEKILKFYQKLSKEYKEKNTDVAARSSGTAEDLPTASFAGMYETFLNIKGGRNLLLAVKRCFASAFGARVVSYREEKGFDHMKNGLSVGIQKMIRSDLASSGVIFTLDTESGFPDVVLINGTWGIGEMIVKGKIIPDEFLVFKRTLIKGQPAIIRKDLGTKRSKMIYTREKRRSTKIINTTREERRKFVLSDAEILKLAHWAIKVERYYSKKAGEWRPMDIEWAKDGKSQKLFFVQARPETVHGSKEKKSFTEYILKEEGKILTTGISIGEKIGAGSANVIRDLSGIKKFRRGEILVTKMTDPDWEPIMKIASGIVTDEGSRVCHAAIVSRELGIPCVVGTEDGSLVIPHGKDVTVNCSKGEKGFIYAGKIPFKTKEHKFKEIPRTRTEVSLNVGSPDIAFRSSFLPNDGVGLAREEFIFASEIKVHPLALIHFNKLPRSIKKKIEKITAGYNDKKEFFVEKLAQGVGRIAAAFYPKEVIVRFSDFKTNEYANLVGGESFEPKESNPMIGWRGASRYYSEKFQEAFLLECKAIKKARETYGLKNIVIEVPFCRTVEEGEKVLELMKKANLRRGHNGLKVIMMCEIPSNVILAKEFLEIFDGLSIGSNDLTQLTLGIDRDSAILAQVGDERNEAVKKLLKETIEACRKKGKYSGICGDAPSTFPELTRFLVKAGIKSISVNPDVAVKTRLIVAEVESKQKLKN
ncbi:MAG: phosphoenolpyruvate synthase [Candidatus Bathyarchaeota archaeon]|nr:phosphoenolpyruvate synthase [Candidatus Bathyarchaeota archaeon]